MLRYIPGGLESVLNDKRNAKLVMDIDKRFFNSCIFTQEDGSEFKDALQQLIDAGEGDFVKNIDAYLFSDG